MKTLTLGREVEEAQHSPHALGQAQGRPERGKVRREQRGARALPRPSLGDFLGSVLLMPLQTARAVETACEGLAAGEFGLGVGGDRIGADVGAVGR